MDTATINTRIFDFIASEQAIRFSGVTVWQVFANCQEFGFSSEQTKQVVAAWVSEFRDDAFMAGQESILDGSY